MRPLAALLGVLLARLGHAAIGDPIGGELQVNAYSTGAQGEPAIAPDGAGGFVVVWHSDGSPTDHDSFSIQARRFDAAAAPLGGEFQVNTYTTAPQREPAVARDGAGGFVVVWQSGGGTGSDADFTSIQARRFTAAGAPLGGEIQVNTYTTTGQVHAAVAPDGAGGFVVVWESGGSAGSDTSDASIQARRFTATGAPVGDDFQVNVYTTGAQDNPAVAPDGAGGFVVVWESDGGAGTDTNFESVQARRFGPSGPVGGEFQVNAYTTAGQRYPAVSSLAGGGFVVVWQSDASAGSDRSGRSVQGQVFGAGGAPAGAQFEVNAYTTGTQDVPAVGQDGGNGFVVVWESDQGGGTDQLGFSAQGRHFDAAGAPLGGDFQVNTYTTSSQSPYAVGPEGGGGFVVVWDGGGSAETDNFASSVHLQRYVGPNTPTTTSTTPVVVTTTTLPFGAQPLAGRALVLRTTPGKPQRSGLAVRAKDRRVTLGRGNGSLDDPVLHGGSLTLTSAAGGFAVTHELVGGWAHVGRPGRNKGYRWKSPGTIRRIVVKRGKSVQVKGRGLNLGFDLDNNPSPVRVALAIGGHVYCLEFGGRNARFRANRRYAARKAAAPAACF